MKRYYFDHNATTPVSAGVLEALLPALSEVYGNASSIHHYGQIAKQHLEVARRQVAGLLGCEAREVIFTAGGTESNNIAIFGAVPGHVVTTAIEHPAVLRVCERFDVTFVPVGSNGIVDPDDIRRAIRPATRLISVMHANNEIGAIQPIAEIARIAHEAGATITFDGENAIGQLVAARCCDHAARLADENGIGVVTARESNHFGAAAFWAQRISAHRRIGFVLCNASPLVPPWQGREGRLGTNPICMAVPGGEAPAWLQDAESFAQDAVFID